ncbi:MAG: allantoate amidohydrolase [Acidobacteriota bacterium]
MFDSEARLVIDWCRRLAAHTEVPGTITRRCLTDPMRLVHRDLMAWMTRLGLSATVDAAGNLRGVRAAAVTPARTLYLGSHLDTVLDAGAFDGILGVIWALAVVESLGDLPLPAHIEVLGFSDEEGVRFGTPFIGSRALIGTCDEELLRRTDDAGVTLRDALKAFGAHPRDRGDAIAAADAIGYLECHIEQGPVLEHLDRPLGVVEHIVGQTRADITFRGLARHAGTTPMHLRHDAGAGAADWMSAVEQLTSQTPGAVATVGRISVEPGAVNVIPGVCHASVDVRHAIDATRRALIVRLREAADRIATRRGLTVAWIEQLDQSAVTMDASMTAALVEAVEKAAIPYERMTSGAGHDAMVLASRMPVGMLFVRSPGGISHHPDETVRVEDVGAAIAVGRECVLAIAGGLRV